LSGNRFLNFLSIRFMEQQYRTPVYVLSTLVLMVALTVAYGWISGNEILKRVFPDAVPMKVTTLLGLAAVSVAILLLINTNTIKQKLAFVLSLTTALLGIGALIYIQYSDNVALPYWISPQTGLCIVAMGTGLMLLQSGNIKLRRAGQGLFHFVTLMGFLATMGYAFHVKAFYTLSFATSMAFNTSFSFILISVAASLLNPALGFAGMFTGSRLGDIVARRLFFQMALLVLVLGYLRVLSHDRYFMNLEFGIALFSAAFIVVSLFLIWKTSEGINKTELQKNAAEEYFQKAIEAAPSGFIITDKSRKITLMNSAAEEMFGYKRQEVLGREIEILIPQKIRKHHPDNTKGYMKKPSVRYFGGTNYLHAVRKDGTEFPVEIGLNPVYTNNEMFVLSSIIDISERRKNEEIIKAQLAELTVKNKDLEQFNYIASHDLQEPLRTVANFAEMIREDYPGQVDGNIKFYLDTINAATNRMSILIRSLLDFSKIGRGRQLTIVDCNTMVSDVVADLASLIKKSRAKITVDELPTINAYDTELRQVFQNLINNAIKFRKEDTLPEIHITATRLDDVYEFAVADNGIGINPRHFNKIFQIFQRLHKEEEFSGHGIGLANCYKIIQLHEGKIWVESEYGKGSTFIFTIKTN
jgi:PAS domain S-box-containing protein